MKRTEEWIRVAKISAIVVTLVALIVSVYLYVDRQTGRQDSSAQNTEVTPRPAGAPDEYIPPTAPVQAQEESVPVLQPKDPKSGMGSCNCTLDLKAEWWGTQDEDEQDQTPTPEPTFPEKKTWHRLMVRKMCDVFAELFPDKVEMYDGHLYRVITGEVVQAYDEVVQPLIDGGDLTPEPGLGEDNTDCFPPE